jgi:iron complex outermembrane receptor protein
MKYSIVLIACLAAWPPAWAQDESEQKPDRIHGEAHEHTVLEEVRVTAAPLAKDALEMTQSASVLAGEALNRQLGNSLGETLKNMPGVSSASFGGNVGRPVIRGLDASRVGVMENNVASNDVSKVSQDHAVSIEPFLADQIEVLRGPATLLYGSDTIGGVVNVRSNRVPVDPAQKATGRAQIQIDSAASERYGVARMDWGTRDATWGFHADAFRRETSDYDIPGFAETDPEPGEAPPGSLFNSALDNQGGALGASWFGEKWRIGLAASLYDSDYGIPGEAHGHEDDHEEEGDHGEEEEAAPVTIALTSRRIDSEAQASNPFAGFSDLKLLLSHSDYEHTEFEGAEIGTVFYNDTLDGRLELTHHAMGAWRGVLGLQYRDRDFSALGEEAFVPPTVTESIGLFILEEAQFDAWRLDVGARIEDTDTRTADGRRASHAPLSFSAGALWHVTEASHFAINLARAQRAPGDQELYADGPHLATQTFELGDASLEEETSRSYELSFRRHAGRLTGTVSVYRNEFDDFIYLADTGHVEDGLPLRQWTQHDARFTGAELELRYDFGAAASGHWQATLFADTVDAELTSGQALPRIPPRRIGLGLEWDQGPWAAGLSWLHAAAQTDIADFETATAGYDDLGLELSYRFGSKPARSWELFARAANLLDEEIRNHGSSLKHQAPHAGRNFTLGARLIME